MLLRVLHQTQINGVRKGLNPCLSFSFVNCFPTLNSSKKNIWTAQPHQVNIRKKKNLSNFQNAESTLTNSITNSLQYAKTINTTSMDCVQTNVMKLPKVYASLSKWYLTRKYHKSSTVYVIVLLLPCFIFIFAVFVAMTMDAGFCLASVPFNQFTFLLTTFGTIMCSASANTLNQVLAVKIIKKC